MSLRFLIIFILIQSSLWALSNEERGKIERWDRYIQEGDRVRAIKEANHYILNKSQVSAELHAWLGKVYIEIQAYQQARLRFEDALKQDPFHRISHLQLGNHYIRQEQWLKAAQHLNRGIDPLKPEPKLYLSSGQCFAKGEQHVAAIIQYKKGLVLEPEHPQLFRAMIRSLLSIERHEEARGVLLSALHSEPTHADYWQMLGELHWKLNAPEAAIDHYEAALIYQPDQQQWRRRLGEFYLAQNWASEALRHWQKVKKRDETLELMRVRAMLRVDRVKEANQVLTSLNLKSQDNPRIKGLLADTHYEMKRYREARELYRSMGHDGTSSYQAALCSIHLHEKGAAQAELQRARLFNETKLPALKQLIQLSIDDNDTLRAKEYAIEVYRLESNDPWIKNVLKYLGIQI